MSIGFGIITDEDAEEDDHSYLPDEAHSRETRSNISILRQASKTTNGLQAIPHFRRGCVRLLLSVFCVVEVVS